MSAPVDSPESLALAAARKSGKDVAVPALTTESTDVTAQADGTLVATVHSQPVRTRKDGAWALIDTRLATLPDGSVAPKAVLSDVEFSGGGSQPLVRMAQAGKELSLTWPTSLPAPVLDGATATYPSVFPDVDLRMTATTGGFAQTIVVKSAEAAKNPQLDQVRLGLSSTDLTVKENTDNSLSAVDAAGGGTVFTAPIPVMYDSTAAGSAAAGIDPPASDSGNKTVAKTTGQVSLADDSGGPHAAPVGVDIPAGDHTLALTPDQTLLDAPGTVYPVMIDPNWTTPHAGSWAGISKAWPSNSYWKFSGDFGMGYCVDSSCAAGDVKRVLYALPVKGQPFAGKHILSAEFDVYESHSYSCTNEPVQLYATKAISSGTTWNNASSTTGSSPFWATRLQTVSESKGWSSSCPAGYQEFGGDESTALRAQLQKTSDANSANLTLGLKAQDETSANGDEWKRFTSDGSMRVEYNLPPKQPLMKDLSMSPGSACQTAVVPVNKWPQVTAKVYDLDGEKIGVQFAAAWTNSSGFGRHWWSTGAEANSPGTTTFKASGSMFSATLPASVPGNTGVTVGWEVRAWDGAQWGPWSSAGDVQTDCYFTIDSQKPPGPVTTSASFPGSADATAPLPWINGVGHYGTFTFTSVKSDAVSYQYALDTSASSAHAVSTTAGAPASVLLLMQQEGPHFLSVRAVDAAGNGSVATSYYFNVMAGDPDRAGWSMDDQGGTTDLAGRSGTYNATLYGGAAGGADGHTNTALTLPGATDASSVPTDYAATDRAVLDTPASFTVSAWVKTSDTTVGQAAVSQDGTYNGGFSLGLYDGKWTLKIPTLDAAGYAWQSVASSAPVVAGQWTHLTGVYNQTTGTITIYVNGVGSTPVAAPSVPDVRGVMQFGRMLWKDTYADAWKGALDEVKVWDRALSGTEAATVAADGTPSTGLPAKAVWSLDQTGTTMTGNPQTTGAHLSGAVTLGGPGVVNKAAHFGSTGYARTPGPQVDGARSFSVSAWVKLPAPVAGDTKAKMAVTQNGVHNGQFSLYYSASGKDWVFARYQSDSATAPLIYANQPVCTVGKPDSNGVPCIGPTTGEWTHLVGVADATAHRIQLYVNGYLVGSNSYTQTSPWSTPGGLQIGAVNREGANDEFFGGDIDDVRVFDRPLAPSEIQTMIQQRPLLAGRWKLNTGTTTSPDDLNLRPLTLHDQAGINTDTPLVGTGALSLDGTGDYAATSTPPLHTGQSFTIAGWEQTAGAATRDMTLWSLGNGTDSAVTVRWHYIRTDHDPDSPDDPAFDTVVGEWQVETVDTGTTAVHTIATHSNPAQGLGNWNHVAIAYDSFSNQLSLYIDGQLEDQVCDDDDTSGTCINHTSVAGANQPFEATAGLQIGRNHATGPEIEYFSGQIDDVWAYQGVLSSAQIITLANGEELDSTTGP
ncbi:LamG-like jellyroll fold domain-containing protein [Streptomyces sp. NBC_01190]|uniref:LamG-like jellyroll fold domain-containing protein n=1 Tax=Streptomyces sp. NBC_01190 TaxID=2903767 RepID=UPI00386ABA78|nr:hypothetical protein OG519_28860 [Streptomyces sp. NBC_01190]